MRVQVGIQVYDTASGGPSVASRRADGSVAVRHGETVRTAFVAGDQVWIDGRVRRVRPIAGGVDPAALPTKVTPPMPATVVKVLVGVGESVTVGQKLVTVAAMKMETALRSPRAGVVKAVNVVPGQQVRPGEELVVVEAA
ncbi:MAG: biotin/lipoyl-containing protein [Pseudomonadota bacterium]|nr:biotin/lipoyl-containing protein [Pseudomonadota bacterium]